ncbi:hypothetical protein BU15DRAFT_63382 [Melanogaster broomeanus]|nr:hypothetical protein BU15DRAFT_63382 [Melanogaster broomeanus]
MPFDAPVEIICHILSFLSPREIVRLRRISKQFRNITYDHAIWKIVYANAPLLLPAGPFPYQSASFSSTLESTQNDPSRLLSVSWDRRYQVVIHGGLFSVGSGSSGHETTQVLCHDLDSGTGCRHILWDGDVQINQLDACLITSVDGQRVYIMVAGTQLLVDQGEQTRIIVKLLEFEVDDNSCSFSGPVSMDIPLLPLQPPAYYISALDWCHRATSITKSATTTDTVEDPRNCLLPIRGTLMGIPGPLLLSSRRLSFPTPSHVQTGEGICKLCLTHEAPIEDTSFHMCLLRNSVFDPVTKATNLRILYYSEPFDNNTKYTCVDLTLSEPSPGSVLPISVHWQHLFTAEIELVLYGLTASSDDGHLRGFSAVSDPTSNVHFARRFSIDASEERCIAVVGGRCSMDRDPIIFARGKGDFDGVRGRIYYAEGDRGTAMTLLSLTWTRLLPDLKFDTT